MKNKYIIKNKYEGLDPRIVELLKLGKKIKGYYRHEEDPTKYVGELVNYCHGKKHPFRILEEDGFCNEYAYFEPIFEEERVGKKQQEPNITCKCPLLPEEFITADRYDRKETDWSKVPIDTKILVWDQHQGPYDFKEDKYGFKERRYFAGITKNGRIKAWVDGRTSWTNPLYNNSKNIMEWDHAEIYKEEK